MFKERVQITPLPALEPYLGEHGTIACGNKQRTLVNVLFEIYAHERYLQGGRSLHFISDNAQRDCCSLGCDNLFSLLEMCFHF